MKASSGGLRVLMIASSYPKYPGDTTAPFVESIARAVLQRGHDVDVLLPEHPQLRRDDERLPVAGRTCHLRVAAYRYAPSAGWARWGYAQSLEADVRLRRGAYLLAPLVAACLRRALSARLQGRRYDVVQAHWLVPNAVLVADIVRAHGLPLVVSLHGSDVFVAERLAPARWLARATLQRAGSVTACSGDLAWRAARLGAPPARTHVVPYGVDVHDFAPERARAGLRESLGVPADALWVLALGRLVEKKGFATLIEAAAGLQGVCLTIAGEGDLRTALAARAAGQGTALRLPGNLDRETIAAALASADVVVVPSVVDRAGNVDGLPNTLLEALASGAALVASRVAGIPEVLRDGQEGLLVPPGDVAALRAALLRLRDAPELRRSLGDAARRRAVDSLTWQAAGAAFEACYREAGAGGQG